MSAADAGDVPVATTDAPANVLPEAPSSISLTTVPSPTPPTISSQPISPPTKLPLRTSLLEDHPLYAINKDDLRRSGRISVNETQSLKFAWMEAKLALQQLSKPMYICAFVQLVAEISLVGPGLFNLVDWLIAALGVCAALLVISSCCTFIEAGFFYAVLLNLLAIVLEFIPIANFIAYSVRKASGKKGIFGLFPSYTLGWRLALALAAWDFVVLLIRVRDFHLLEGFFFFLFPPLQLPLTKKKIPFTH